MRRMKKSLMKQNCWFPTQVCYGEDSTTEQFLVEILVLNVRLKIGTVKNGYIIGIIRLCQISKIFLCIANLI